MLRELEAAIRLVSGANSTPRYFPTTSLTVVNSCGLSGIPSPCPSRWSGVALRPKCPDASTTELRNVVRRGSGQLPIRPDNASVAAKGSGHRVRIAAETCIKYAASYT
jgi:hypothetical protein